VTPCPFARDVTCDQVPWLERRLVQTISALASGCGASTAADLFTGTTRVAQELKRQGAFVTAVDTAPTPRCSLSAMSAPTREPWTMPSL